MQQLTNGTLLQGGKYKIEKKIGQGGFGITYKACQPLMLGRKVCIKEFCLKQHFSRDSTTYAITYPNDTARKDAEMFQQKFIKEAQTLYSMRHPNIMEIYDIFEENNTAYYVMEYIEGESLKDMLERRGCIPEAEAIGYIRKVAEALKYIHSRNINHFDVKPANILVRSSDKEVILIDFGTAKHYDSTTGNATTMTSGLLSPGYAPIEQYQQGGVSAFTPETDIYALGATLYKLLTGNTPPEPTEIISNGLPELPSSVSKATKDLVKWTMQLNKADRPHTCDEFMNAIPSNIEGSFTGHKNDTDDATISIDSEETTYLKKQKCNSEENKLFKQSEKTKIKNDNKTSRRKPVLLFVIPILFVLLGGSLYYVYENVFLQERYKEAIASNDINALQELLDNSSISQNQRDSINYKIEAINVKTTPPISEPQEFKYKGVTIKMIPVEGGHFNMGATTEMKSRNKDELPVHDVLLNGFAISETEITEAMYHVVEGYEYNGSRKNIPMTNITLVGCIDFCKDLSKITGKKFRLPTIAEWEYAARGGQLSKHYKYSGGDDINEVAWHRENSNGRIHEVGTKKPNELGLYDMTGNAVEWCYDHYVPGYKTENQVNPVNKLSSENPPRECRGGSYLTEFSNCHISYRFHVPQWAWVTDYLGFRVVMVE